MSTFAQRSAFYKTLGELDPKRFDAAAIFTGGGPMPGTPPSAYCFRLLRREGRIAFVTDGLSDLIAGSSGETLDRELFVETSDTLDADAQSWLFGIISEIASIFDANPAGIASPKTRWPLWIGLYGDRFPDALRFGDEGRVAAILSTELPGVVGEFRVGSRTIQLVTIAPLTPQQGESLSESIDALPAVTASLTDHLWCVAQHESADGPSPADADDDHATAQSNLEATLAQAAALEQFGLLDSATEAARGAAAIYRDMLARGCTPHVPDAHAGLMKRALDDG